MPGRVSRRRGDGTLACNRRVGEPDLDDVDEDEDDEDDEGEEAPAACSPSSISSASLAVSRSDSRGDPSSLEPVLDEGIEPVDEEDEEGELAKAASAPIRGRCRDAPMPAGMATEPRSSSSRIFLGVKRGLLDATASGTGARSTLERERLRRYRVMVDVDMIGKCPSDNRPGANSSCAGP
jgi:hypothetical protein